MSGGSVRNVGRQKSQKDIGRKKSQKNFFKIIKTLTILYSNIDIFFAFFSNTWKILGKTSVDLLGRTYYPL